MLLQPDPKELPATDAPWCPRFSICPSPPSDSFSCCLTYISHCNFSQILIALSLGDLQKKFYFFSFACLKAPINCTLLGLLLAANKPQESFYSCIRDLPCSSVTPLTFSIDPLLPRGMMQHSPDQKALEAIPHSNIPSPPSKGSLSAFHNRPAWLRHVQAPSPQLTDPPCWLFSSVEAKDTAPATLLPKHSSQMAFPIGPTCS